MFMIGAGGHVVWVEPARELVCVSRWVDPQHTDALCGKVLRALD